MKIRFTTLVCEGRDHDREATIYERPSKALIQARIFIQAQWGRHKDVMGAKAKRADLHRHCHCQIVEYTIEGTNRRDMAIIAAMCCNNVLCLDNAFADAVNARASVTGTRVWDQENGRMVERKAVPA